MDNNVNVGMKGLTSIHELEAPIIYMQIVRDI